MLKKKIIKIYTIHSRYAINFIMNYCKCVQVVECAFQLDLKSVVNYSIQIRELVFFPLIRSNFMRHRKLYC